MPPQHALGLDQQPGATGPAVPKGPTRHRSGSFLGSLAGSDGTRQVTNVATTNRALSTDDAASTYVTFTVSAGQNVTIFYSPNMSSSSSCKNVIINAVSLDLPNPELQTSGETPSNRDYHVDADSGSLGWRTPPWGALPPVAAQPWHRRDTARSPYRSPDVGRSVRRRRLRDGRIGPAARGQRRKRVFDSLDTHAVRDYRP